MKRVSSKNNSKWRNLMPKKRGLRYVDRLRLPIAKKLMNDLMREKTILFAIFLQLFIIMTSAIIITNANTLFNPVQVCIIKIRNNSIP
jgi:hypothetical protein